nr:Chain A, Major curlin subunit [Escherichia coli K-12]
LNIYQY